MIILLMLLMILLYTLQSLFSKYFALSYEGESTNASLVFATVFGVVIAASSFALGGFKFSPSPETVAYALGNAAMLVLFHLSQIGASVRGSYAIQNLCMLFGGILVPMAASMLLLDQSLSLPHIIAVAALFLSFVLLNIEGVSMTGTKKGYWFFCIILFLSNGFFGAFNTLQANKVGGDERSEMIVIGYLGSALLAFLCLLARRGKKAVGDFKMSGKSLLLALSCSVIAALAINVSMYLYTVVNTTVLASVDNGGVLVTGTLAAILLFKERPTRLQYIGLAIALISVIALNIPF